MLETLTILPMAPGTRSRRTDVLHRATPVLLPKPNQRQTTLDQHLHSVGVRPRSAGTRPPPALQQPLQQSQQRAPRQQQQKQQQRRQQPQSQLQASQLQQQQLSFAIAAPTRSIQNILNHANSMGSMSAARPKRKIAADDDESTAKLATNGHVGGSGRRSDQFDSRVDAGTDADDSDNALDSALRKRPRLAVEIVDVAKSPGLQSPPGALAPAPPPNKAGAAIKTNTNTAGSNSLAAAVPIAPFPNTASTTTPTTSSAPHSASTPATASTHTPTRRPIAARQHPAIPATHRAPVLDRATRDNATTSTSTTSSSLHKHAVPPAAPSPIPLPSDAARSHRLNSGRSVPKPASQLATKPPKEKAVNGFKQELKALQVSTAEAEAVAATRGPREGGRKLRSQEATRFKSDLAAYFPDYDEVIGNEPKEEHILNIDTPIIFVESTPAHPATNLPTSTISTPLAASLRSSDRAGSVRVKGYGDKLFYDVFDSHVLDFTFLGNQHKSKGTVDPLPDSYFEAHHKRAERLERSIRNTEKGRAQHEKDQIMRLLEGLQGPDWLRTMGVSGITESKKKTFEPAREHFIRGSRAILEKFRLWSVEEKRRKLEKDRAHALEVKAREAAADAAAAHTHGRGKAKADNTASKSSRGRRDLGGKALGKRATRKSLDDSDVAGQPDDEVHDDEEAAEDAGDDEAAEEDEVDDDSQPDSSDFDAVIAQQLREEALARSRLASKAAASANKRRKPNRAAKQDAPPSPTSPLARPPSPSQPPDEVTSFFRKRYQRDAALSRGRRKGRTVMAWGQPVPEPAETDFSLPGEILNQTGVAGRGRRGGARTGARGRGGARGGVRGVGRK
ncbi:uncharacterized protein SPSK_03989 [Sporothrix schenckii 1099-18]|uniref:Something about silencing protein 4 domain-containing protein n=1 Tax=Sporothrix schenckii 1099-18 TaxID=1397361 RepID=A0A0F2M302_SPOSC|nr:uncharacterized protein SPSK_03989 [Sporothrix schenckii 1099-18]KJR83140.1 hypothetical protein SPSK_03989 [Sporothrix schenckii 1099-18]